jgi:hypothetical protein
MMMVMCCQCVESVPVCVMVVCLCCSFVCLIVMFVCDVCIVYSQNRLLTACSRAKCIYIHIHIKYTYYPFFFKKNIHLFTYM